MVYVFERDSEIKACEACPCCREYDGIYTCQLMDEELVNEELIHPSCPLSSIWDLDLLEYM